MDDFDPRPAGPRERHLALVAAAGELTSAASLRGRVPPCDKAAEMAVLGAILLANEAFPDVDGIVEAGDFYYPAHGTIYEAMRALAGRGSPIDVNTLVAELRSLERLNTVGGAQYVGELTDTIPTIAHVEAHAEIVADLATVRRTVTVAEEITARGYGAHGPADAFCDFATSRIFDVAQKRSKGTLVSVEQSIIEAFAQIEQSMGGGGRITGRSTGFRDLDTLTAGMHPGQLIIVAGRPGAGKSSLGLDICMNTARVTGDAAMFFSLEMPRIELTNRMLCSEARVDQSRLRSGLLTQDDITALTGAANALHGLPIFIDDAPSLTIMDLRAKARRMKRQQPVGVIVIDYLQLMKGSRANADNREGEVSEISHGLKALAKELEVPIVALAQLNRACETRPGKNKRPMLADLRESGSIEMDADVVVFIYRDELYNKDTEDKGIAELIVAKQRNGPTDTVRLRFLKELTKFENLAMDDSGADYHRDAHASLPDETASTYEFDEEAP